MRVITVLLFFAGYVASAAQSPEVPRKMHFAGMTLTIHDDARAEIQKDVDALTRYPKYFNIKVERAKTYFPIIEKIFAEERLPDDFKFLVLQESALIPDAVSVSDAVGFWQFKDFTAEEMGLRVDKEIDERMNIVSSTRAAARYLKKNNIYFNNWLYALQAYQMGAGGVMKAVKDSQSGAHHMNITSKTYWYVKKYLAHKIAFENAVSGPGEVQVELYENKDRTTLRDLAKTVALEEEQLQSYNKWIRKERIPDDKAYIVVLPHAGSGVVNQDAALAAITSPPAPANASTSTETSAATVSKKAAERKKINGIWAVKPQTGETPTTMAKRVDVGLSDFLKYNDISINSRLQTDTWYFTGKKRARAEHAYHKVAQGESLWDISQQYGVRMKKLLRFNRIKSANEIKPGMMVWLSAKKPAHHDKQSPEEVLEVNDEETFNWDAAPAASKTQPTPTKTPETSARVGKQEVVTAPTPEKTPTAEPEKTTPATVPTTPATPTTPAVTPAQPTLSTDQPEASAQPQETVVTARTDTVAAKTPTNTPVKPGTKTTSAEKPVTTPTQQTDKQSTITVTTKAPAPTITVVPSTKPTRHTVAAGETLYGISRKYDIPVKDLMAWNNLTEEAGIHPGQKLTLEPAEPVKTEEVQPSETKQPQNKEIIHEVKNSDTLYGVARKYGVTIKELMDWNNKTDFNIAVGEKLKIYTK